LSGGYYIAVAGDYIYVDSSSYIGNVGAIGVMPSTYIPSETVIETGAYKTTGFSKLRFPYTLTHVLENFVSAIKTNRGERLAISLSELKSGIIYMGSEAVKLGLADEVGSLQKAISKAAEKAGIVKYETIDIISILENSNTFSSRTQAENYKLTWRNLTINILNRFYPPPSVWYLYLPPNASRYNIGMSAEKINENITLLGENVSPFIIVDASHGNRISASELDILIAESAKNNITVTFISDWSKIKLGLENASALIIASPTKTYSIEEVNDVENYVNRGGLLLLFFDPAQEYLDVSELSGPINSISSRFGLTFANGYLYNMEEHYGFYRNIYVRQFRNASITKNINSLVLFTATYIHSMNKEVAWTSNNTYSSTAERMGNYTVIAVTKRNGTVIAFSDKTFLQEPYCYIEDNYKLILNIVSEILSVKIRPVVERITEETKEIERPHLPVGTIKEFTAWINGEEYSIRWIKASETEIIVEEPNRTTHYYYNEEEALTRYTSNGLDVVYDIPIPSPPYPLTKSKTWNYRSNYTLRIDGKEARGIYIEECYVEKLENIETSNGKTYFSAKINCKIIDRFKINDRELAIVAEGSSWISSEAGQIKEEYSIYYYTDGALTGQLKVKTLLKSIQEKNK